MMKDILARPQPFENEVAGRNLSIGIGKLAGQADAAVTVRYGDSVVLVTVGVADEPREGIDFLPLTIEYEERLYAAGKIPGGFIRREGRPSQDAILASRLTDRPLRPLLTKTWRREIQIIVTVLSADQENDPDLLAVIGASAALNISQVPFKGPVSATRVGYINGELVVNPILSQMDNSELDLVVVSSKDAIVMIEGGSKEVPEDLIVRAIQLGNEANQPIIALQEELQQAWGKPKAAVPIQEKNPEVEAAIASLTDGKLADALTNQPNKAAREEALGKIKKLLMEQLGERFSGEEISQAFDTRVKAEIRNVVMTRNQHIDGRGLTEVRPIGAEAGLLPRTHGSALFTRGETQVLTITTLGSKNMEQILDGLGIEDTKRFIHHYNFPPFSSGEVKRLGLPSRREIGHGALAEKALVPVIPKEGVFPYTIRLVSEVLSSSGSTSMGSVCASSLSLMDAGVPIKAAVAGIAMGLVTDESGGYRVLTDIEGIEDANGDMDFKVAGTRDGITAVQLDIKLTGISLEIIEKALRQAKDARCHILDIMNEALPAPRKELSRYAPRMYKITIPTDKIGTVIGPGGKTIRSIIGQTKTTIDIEDDGTVVIGASSEESADKAIKIIEGLTREPEIGTVYTGKVSRILNFGAMVEILPGKEGLVHISELADHRVEKVEDVVKIGDEITVKLIDIDDMGRLNLSRRALLGGPPRPPRPSRPPMRSNTEPDRRDDRHHDSRPRYPRENPG